MADKHSNIKSSQPRNTPLETTIVNGFMPQNGATEPGKKKAMRAVGRDTRNIEKSSSQTLAGPKTNNL